MAALQENEPQSGTKAPRFSCQHSLTLQQQFRPERACRQHLQRPPTKRRRALDIAPINRQFCQIFTPTKRNFKLLDEDENVLVNDSILFLDEQCFQYDELELNYVHDRLKIIDNTAPDPPVIVATPVRPCHKSCFSELRSFQSPAQSLVKHTLAQALEVDTPSQVNFVDEEPALLTLLDEAKLDFSGVKDKGISYSK